MRRIVLAWAVAATIFAAFAWSDGTTVHTRTVYRPVGSQVLYITNHAQRYISNETIERDIPAWEQAVNVDFAQYWQSAHYKLVFLGQRSAPAGAMSAVFVDKGPVKGALAYHDTERGNAPDITVYAGTGVYYGYSNSVSFTHELFELAADPVVSAINQGFPYDYYYRQKADGKIEQDSQLAVGWFQEVSDPVEADTYTINGVKISDFVTPSWFGDGVGTRYDFLGLCQQPFWIRPGGYGQYLSPVSGWTLVENFRTGHPSDRGFLDGDGRRT